MFWVCASARCRHLVLKSDIIDIIGFSLTINEKKEMIRRGFNEARDFFPGTMTYNNTQKLTGIVNMIRNRRQISTVITVKNPNDKS